MLSAFSTGRAVVKSDRIRNLKVTVLLDLFRFAVNGKQDPWCNWTKAMGIDL